MRIASKHYPDMKIAEYRFTAEIGDHSSGLTNIRTHKVFESEGFLVFRDENGQDFRFDLWALTDTRVYEVSGWESSTI